MKILKYEFNGCLKSFPWSEDGEKLAKKEYGGEYAIVDITEEEAEKMGFTLVNTVSADDVVTALFGGTDSNRLVAAEHMRKAVQLASSELTDEQSLEVATIFDPWVIGVPYSVGERFLYKDKLYRVAQAHTSQADWTPDAVPALYTVISMDENGGN